jgi:hypothetical protein
MPPKAKIMSNVSSVAVITLRTTRDAWPTKENLPTSLSENIYSPCTNQTSPIHPTRSNICPNNKTKLLLPIKHTSASSSIPKSSDREELKNRMKGLFEQMGTMLNLLTAAH